MPWRSRCLKSTAPPNKCAAKTAIIESYDKLIIANRQLAVCAARERPLREDAVNEHEAIRPLTANTTGSSAGRPIRNPQSVIRNTKTASFVFATLDDCKDITRLCGQREARGGDWRRLLGLEAARGLLNLGLKCM